MNDTPPPDAMAAQDALVGMIEEDKERVEKAIQALIEHGISSVYAALCGWSSVTASAMIGEHEDGEWYIEVIDDRTGKQVSIDDTDISPAVRDAMRMVTMFKNDDHPMMMALFRTYWTSKDDSLFSFIMAVLHFATMAARHHMDTRHPQAPPPPKYDLRGHPDYMAMTGALRKFDKNKNHKVCPRILKDCMAAGGIEITVSTCRPLVHGPYTTDPYICPHGTRFWVEPTGEQIARWAKDGTP